MLGGTISLFLKVFAITSFEISSTEISKDVIAKFFQNKEVVPPNMNCYSMRHRNEELNVTGNQDYHVNILATSILGFLWNNHVTFGRKFPKKKPEAPADKIHVFMEDVVEEVKQESYPGSGSYCQKQLHSIYR